MLIRDTQRCQPIRFLHVLLTFFCLKIKIEIVVIFCFKTDQTHEVKNNIILIYSIYTKPNNVLLGINNCWPIKKQEIKRRWNLYINPSLVLLHT